MTVARLKSRAGRIYVHLVLGILEDSPVKDHPLNVKRDKAYVARRWEAEGDPFLTTALPQLWKAVLQGLESGTYPGAPVGFHSRRGSALPSFLYGLHSIIFSDDGHLRSCDPEWAALTVGHIAQICNLVYKAEFPYTDAQKAAVVQEFVDVEAELATAKTSGALTRDLPLLLNAADLVDDVLVGFDPLEIVPRHGPGAVASGERDEEKWDFKTLYLSIHRVFNYLDYFGLRGVEFEQEFLEKTLSMDFAFTGCAKVVLVPKDSRGPRLISMEPLEYQFVQQGVGRSLSRHLEYHRLSRGQVNFTDQSINGELALESSRTQKYATLDLSAASDRVSLDLVRMLFPERVIKAFEAIRTSHTALPNGQVLPLLKFAPMGSAVCFPVEALCFWALAVCAVERELNRPREWAAKNVFVYGDDIIVPTDAAEAVMSALESCLLRVNRAKSFVRGFFRESCGTDAYHGYRVTPVKIHTLFSSKKDPRVLASYSAAANQLQQKGYNRAARVIWALLKDTWGILPWGIPGSPYVHRQAPSAVIAESRNKLLFKHRWSDRYQRLEFFLPTLLREGTRDTTLDGSSRLLRDLVSPRRRPDQEPIRDSIKWSEGWAPVGLTPDERRGFITSLGL